MKKIDSQLIKYIENSKCDIKTAAIELGVSEQTVRNRIKMINSKQTIINIENGILSLDSSYNLNLNQITDYEIIQYLVVIDKVNVKKIASNLYISEKTVYHKVKLIRNELTNMKLFENLFQLHYYIDKYFELMSDYSSDISRKEAHNNAYKLQLFNYENCTVEPWDIINNLSNPVKFKEVQNCKRFTHRLTMFIEYAFDSVEFSSKTLIDLNKHIYSSYMCLKYNVIIDSNISLTIIEKYNEYYQTYKDSMKHFLQIENMDYIETEYLYVFVILLQDILKESNFEKVIILCENGVATSYLVEQQLKEYFEPFTTIFCGSVSDYKQLTSQIPKDAVIIGCGTGDEIETTLNINGFITSEDIQKLSMYLTRRKNTILTDYQLYCQVKPFLKNNVEYVTFKDSLQTGNEEGKLMLVDLIKKDMIQKIDSINSWQQAIEICAQPLLNNKYIEKTYIDAMINNVVELGTYIILVEGFALPHSKPEDGANKVGMSVLSLGEPVVFPDGQNVKIIITLSTSKANEHLQALMDLSNLLKIDNVIDELNKLCTVEEIYEYIRNF